ncbi:MAG: ABC transporter permease, partial [Oscillospiraceae bacterium]
MPEKQSTAAALSSSADVLTEKPESVWKSMWDSLRQNKAAVVSMVFILLLVFIAIITAIFPQVLPHDPYEQDMTKTFIAPNSTYWFGTDQLGRDVFSRVLIGTRVSLSVGVIAVAISLTIGIFFGSLAGYMGGAVDTIIMRVMDVMLSIPSILLAIAFMAALGQGIDKAVIAISLVSIPEYARIIRGEILSVKQNDYVQAARVVGPRDGRLVFHHV